MNIEFFPIFLRVVCVRIKICYIRYIEGFFKTCPSTNNLEEFGLLNMRIVQCACLTIEYVGARVYHLDVLEQVWTMSRRCFLVRSW